MFELGILGFLWFFASIWGCTVGRRGFRHSGGHGSAGMAGSRVRGSLCSAATGFRDSVGFEVSGYAEGLVQVRGPRDLGAEGDARALLCLEGG